MQQINLKQYKSRQDWTGILFHLEMSKGLGFDYTNQEFMHKSKYILENKSLKISRALKFKRPWSPDQKTTFIYLFFYKRRESILLRSWVSPFEHTKD